MRSSTTVSVDVGKSLADGCDAEGPPECFAEVRSRLSNRQCLVAAVEGVDMEEETVNRQLITVHYC